MAYHSNARSIFVGDFPLNQAGMIVNKLDFLEHGLSSHVLPPPEKMHEPHSQLPLSGYARMVLLCSCLPVRARLLSLAHFAGVEGSPAHSTQPTFHCHFQGKRRLVNALPIKAH